MNMSLCKESKHAGSELRRREIFFFAARLPGGRYRGLLTILEGGPRSSPGRVGGFLLCILSISLAVAQRPLCHLINLKSWPQVAHRSQSRRRRRREGTAEVRTTCLASQEEINHPKCLDCQELRLVCPLPLCHLRQHRKTRFSARSRSGWHGLRKQRRRFSRKISGNDVACAAEWLWRR